MNLKPVLKNGTSQIIIDFISLKVNETRSNGVVLGLSGGLDSSVVAKLCLDAIGAEKVLGLIMPLAKHQKKDTDETISFAREFGIPYKKIDPFKVLQSYKETLDLEKEGMAINNLAPRIRMIILYYHANCLNRLVMGTGNKSELMMGYFTKYGDGGVDYLPIGDIYKTQVRDLAKELKIPQTLIDKIPSAGLWEGQTDEGEMGITYDLLDKILYGLEQKCTENEIHNSTNIPLNEIKRIHGIIQRTAHKRMMPQIPKID